MSRRTTPKQFSAYLVRWSDEASMPVDTVLIDKGECGLPEVKAEAQAELKHAAKKAKTAA